MKKEKNGFTLIELLAVIVILLAISVVAIPSISAGLGRTKSKTNESKKTVLASYGEIYFSEHQSIQNKCVNISTLFSSGYITEEEKQDADGNEFTGSITYSNTQKKYIYQDKSCNG